MSVPIDLSLFNSIELKKFIDSFDNIVTDCDGVLHIAFKEIPGSVEAIKKLKELKKTVHYLTNNSAAGIDIFKSRMNEVGFELNNDNFINPTKTILHYLHSINFQKKAYVLGTKKFRDELEKAGIRVVYDPAKECDDVTPQLLNLLTIDPDIGAVILDIDFNLTYMKLIKAGRYLSSNKDLHFLVGATDLKIPLSDKVHILGCGYFYKILKDFCGKSAMGYAKPSVLLEKFINQEFQISNPERTLFIGDSVQHDMAFASHVGFQKLLVFSGVSKLVDMEEASGDEKPDYYIESIGHLGQLLNKYF